MTPRDPRTVAEIAAILSTARGARLRALELELAGDDRAGVVGALRSARSRERARAQERRRTERLYRLECELRAQGYTLVAGADEVGRGALAGPMTVAACVLPASPRIEGLDDSKRLKPQRRAELATQVRALAVCVSVAHVDAPDIDRMGVTAALRSAFSRALADLDPLPDHVIVDGRPLGVARAETAVVKGDASVAAVAAASIVAKVTRDALMVDLAERYSAYGFDINKGYGTAEHLDAIRRTGLSPVHRRSFVPGAGTDRLF